MADYIVLFGSNIEPERNLAAALDRLRYLAETQTESVSSVYESPVVVASGEVDLSRRQFLNAAVLVRSSRGPAQFRQDLRLIEARLGRVRSEDKYADRPVDLDIVGIRNELGEVELDESLWQHAHVALPAADVAPRWQASPDGLTLRDIADEINVDAIQIRRI